MKSLRLSVNGVDCEVPLETARELAARARIIFHGPDRPGYAVAVLLETCCEGSVPVDIAFTDREEVDLGWAVESWATAVGPAELPPAIRALRDALRLRAA